MLESPFPIIAGVSRQVFLNNCDGRLVKQDRISFDLDRGEVYVHKETLARMKFLKNSEKAAKVQTYHHRLFNDAPSHIFICNNGVLEFNTSANNLEVLSNDIDNPDEKSLSVYFSNYLKLLLETFALPVLEIPENLVNFLFKFFYREKIKILLKQKFLKKMLGPKILALCFVRLNYLMSLLNIFLKMRLEKKEIK